MAVLEARALTVGYGTAPVVTDVSFALGNGETVAIIGRSGSGKTTILKALCALIPLSGGAVYLHEGEIISPVGALYEEWEIRRHIALVSQESSLFPHYTVGRNIGIGLEVVKRVSRKDREVAIRQIAKQLGLIATDGADELLNRYPEQLSGGQRQRVQLARSLLLEPDVLLLDEVTSGLDPHATREVIDAVWSIREVNPKLSVVVVSHLLGFVEAFADRVLFLHAGKIHEEAPAKGMARKLHTPEAQAFTRDALMLTEHYRRSYTETVIT